MATLPTPAAAEMAKRVRFSPFVTYLGDEPDRSLEMEGSLQLDSSYTTSRLPGGCANRTITGVGRNNKRGSMDLTELFSVDRPFGTTTMGDGSDDGGFSFGSCDLDVSGQSIIEEDEFDDDEEDFDMDVLRQFGHLELSLSKQSEPSFPSLACIPAADAETEPSGVERRPSEEGKLAVETAA